MANEFKPNRSYIDTQEVVDAGEKYMFQNISTPDIRSFLQFLLTNVKIYTIKSEEKPMNDEVKTPEEATPETPVEETTPATEEAQAEPETPTEEVPEIPAETREE